MKSTYFHHLTSYEPKAEMKACFDPTTPPTVPTVTREECLTFGTTAKGCRLPPNACLAVLKLQVPLMSPYFTD